MRNVILKRLAFSALAGIILAVLINEVSYQILKTSQDRPPQTIVLTIPAGTAQRVARGEADPSLPANLSFVLGDRLVVENKDSESHQLGPFFIPAGSSASLVLDKVQNLTYTCSFRADNSLGLDVFPAVTVITRLQGILFSALPMIILFSLYGIIAIPLQPKEKQT